MQQEMALLFLAHPVGGGRGTNSSLQAVGAFTQAAGNLGLLEASTLPGPCQGLIDNLGNMSGGTITLGSIVSTAGRLVAYDGTASRGLASSMDYNEMFKNSPNYVQGTMPGFTVADYFKNHEGSSALTMLGLNDLGLALVFIRPSVILEHSAAYNTALVMHEILHSLGFEDDKIMSALGLDPAKQASVEITKAFARDCFGVEK
jgi:hypothetical protein